MDLLIQRFTQKISNALRTEKEKQVFAAAEETKAAFRRMEENFHRNYPMHGYRSMPLMGGLGGSSGAAGSTSGGFSAASGQGTNGGTPIPVPLTVGGNPLYGPGSGMGIVPHTGAAATSITGGTSSVPLILGSASSEAPGFDLSEWLISLTTLVWESARGRKAPKSWVPASFSLDCFLVPEKIAFDYAKEWRLMRVPITQIRDVPWCCFFPSHFNSDPLQYLFTFLDMTAHWQSIPFFSLELNRSLFATLPPYKNHTELVEAIVQMPFGTAALQDMDAHHFLDPLPSDVSDFSPESLFDQFHQRSI